MEWKFCVPVNSNRRSVHYVQALRRFIDHVGKRHVKDWCKKWSKKFAELDGIWQKIRNINCMLAEISESIEDHWPPKRKPRLHPQKFLLCIVWNMIDIIHFESLDTRRKYHPATLISKTRVSRNAKHMKCWKMISSNHYNIWHRKRTNNINRYGNITLFSIHTGHNTFELRFVSITKTFSYRISRNKIKCQLRSFWFWK